MPSKIIPYARQSISQSDIDAVVAILHSPYLTQGPTVEAFESAVAEMTGAKYAVAVSSATAALHIACLAAGLKPGSLHWTTPNTFVASANCGLYCGADVDFVDIDPRTYNMSPERLTEKLISAKAAGRLPKTVVPVDFAGQAAQMAEIYEAAHSYGATVIEDASHAIGGLYRGEKIGSGRFADMTIFSFHPVKILTTGEGGLVLTNRKDLYEKLVRFRSHGITRDRDLLTSKDEGAWYYEQLDLGFNYRITDIAAALGLSQLKRLDDFVERRRALVARYNQLLTHLPLILPFQDPETAPAWHLYVVQIDENKTRLTRHQVYDRLRERGIIANVHYIPVHRQPYYARLGFKRGQFKNAEAYYERALSLPLYFELDEKTQDRVIEVLDEIFSSKDGDR
jgi:UDP-4-amino-4,6-dideoxy-N-acetyl-beta-L-altrosamine transaminase